MNELWPIKPSIYNLICILPYLTQNEETRINMQKPSKSAIQGLHNSQRESCHRKSNEGHALITKSVSYNGN